MDISLYFICGCCLAEFPKACYNQRHCRSIECCSAAQLLILHSEADAPVIGAVKMQRTTHRSKVQAMPREAT